MKITIIPEFRDLALEFLGQNHEKEVTERSKIHETQQKTLLDTQAQLDELTRLRIKKLIDDDDYTRERDRLKIEVNKIKQLLSETENRAEKWLELTEQTFDFATYAHARFLTSDQKTKREIMTALGQNPTIKDGKLSIQANKWFIPIMEAYPALEKEYLRLEPNKKRSIKAKTEALTSVHARWYAIVDTIRTRIEENETIFHFPKLLQG